MDEVPNKTSSMYIYNVHTTLLNVTKIYDLIEKTKLAKNKPNYWVLFHQKT